MKNLILFSIFIFCHLLLKCWAEVANLSAYHYNDVVIHGRNTSYAVHPMILSRNSWRQMTGEEIPDEELFELFEAARWAPSAMNIQPWVYVYAKRNTTYWKSYFDLLWPLNQVWAKDAAVLVVQLSHLYEVYKGNKNSLAEYGSYDTGASAMALQLEATARDLSVVAIGGFDRDKVFGVIQASKDDFKAEAMFAIGRRNETVDDMVSQRRATKTFFSEGVVARNGSIIID